jgi:hypothetical protein
LTPQGNSHLECYGKDIQVKFEHTTSFMFDLEDLIP